MTEIELKARVKSPAETEAKLRKFCTFQGETVKKDEYWRNPAGKTLRLRIETGKEPLVTWKIKSINNGVETNDEREFHVSSAGLFSELLRETGFLPVLKKEKRTKTFSVSCPSPGLRGGPHQDKTFQASMELSDVTGLGFFLEIEIVLDNPDGETEKEAGAALRELLAQAGVPESEIEERYYSELLALKETNPLKSNVAK